ncbi:MAG: DUF1819 family protein [Caldilinea sp.]|nr:DUF1819 family protein [Caldilinea sp.]
MEKLGFCGENPVSLEIANHWPILRNHTCRERQLMPALHVALQDDPQWRAAGPYTATSIATAGLLAETQVFLEVYAAAKGTPAERAEATRLALVGGALAQRSRATRVTVTRRIMERLTRWEPPAWVLEDLIAAARQPKLDTLKALLLVHVCRQDVLLYAVAQGVVRARWLAGERSVEAVDVQRFFYTEQATHPEIEEWSHATRNRLASNTLSTLRDFGLLRGASRKEITPPIVPDDATAHVQRLLRAEGIAASEIPFHPDWSLWLWTPTETTTQLDRLPTMKA